MSCQLDPNRFYRYVVPTFDSGDIIVTPESYEQILALGMFACNPNYYNQNAFGTMIFRPYYKGNGRIYYYSYGCVYNTELLSAIVEALFSGELNSPERIRKFLKLVGEWILKTLKNELRNLLYYQLAKLVNDLSFTKNEEYQFIKVIYNPSMPYGFYISITNPISARYRDRIKRKLVAIYNKVIGKRIKIKNTRRAPSSKLGKLAARLGIDKIIRNQLSAFTDYVNRKMTDYIQRGVEAVSNAGEIALQRFIEKHLGKIAKYEPVEEHHIALPSDPERTAAVPYTLDYGPGTVIQATPMVFTFSTSPLGIFYPTKFIEHETEDLSWIKQQSRNFGRGFINDYTTNNTDILPESDVAIRPTTIETVSIESSSEHSYQDEFRKVRSDYLSRVKKSIEVYDALVQKSRIDVIEKIIEIFDKKDEVYYKALKSTHEKLLNALRATPFKTYEENRNVQLNIRDASDIYELINQFSENAFFFIEERYSSNVFSRLSSHVHLNVFNSILSMPIYCISVKQLVDESEDGDVMLYTSWLPGMAAYYVLNHVGERYILKDDYIVRVNIDPQEFYDWAQVQIMENPKKYGRKSFIEMFSIYVKEKYNIQSFAEYVEQTIEEIKRDINPYKYAITAHLIKDYEEEEDPGEKLSKGETIFRIIANALAPLDEQTYDFITHPVDFESFKGNSINNKSAILGQRMAESMFQRRIKELKSEGTYEKRYANESEFLMNLINPVLFYVLNSQEILYNYLSSAEISANNYVLASLEPTTKYFDPLPRRFVYNMKNDREAIRFFTRRKLIEKDLTELNDFYNTEIAVFTDILPLRSLTVEYEGIETDQVGSFFKIDIPTRWNMYQPTIRMEVYDNAHRDLYNYFLRYKKIAFYKSVARPAFDISFILDIISLNADLALQNIVSYIVVPKNIDMKYLEYNEQFSSEPYVISFDFSVIGFIYYTNSGIGTLNTGGLQGTYHHLPGAFIEIDEYPSSIKSKDFIENSYDAMIYYARNAVLNWYGIQNLNPVSVLTNDEKCTGRANAASMIPIINESGNPTEYEKRYWGSFHNLITNELHKNSSYQNKYYRTRGYQTIGSHVIKR